MVYPMFMAGGWFPMTELPRRMEAAGAVDWAYLPPFGLDDRVQALVVTLAQEAAAAQGRTPAQTDILLAAHGSFRSAAPSEVAQAVAQRLKRAGFARADAFFIDQEPRIATAIGFGAGSVCLPFFAAEGGHVTDDLPEALAEAGFGGRMLPPLGLDARVPSLIAAALQGQA
jgi:sirohydrochlorin ferrochelatase